MAGSGGWCPRRHLCLTATPFLPFLPPCPPLCTYNASLSNTIKHSHPSPPTPFISFPRPSPSDLPPAPLHLRRALLNNSLKGIVVVCVLLPLWFLASDRIGLGPSSSIWAPAPASGHGARSNDRRMMVSRLECGVEGHGIGQVISWRSGGREASADAGQGAVESEMAKGLGPHPALWLRPPPLDTACMHSNDRRMMVCWLKCGIEGQGIGQVMCCWRCGRGASAQGAVESQMA